MVSAKVTLLNLFKRDHASTSLIILTIFFMKKKVAKDLEISA